MSTKRSFISDVRTELKKYSADDHLTNKQIWSLVDKHSKWLVRRESDGFKLNNIQNIFQSYNCAEVIDVPKIDPCCNITTKCIIKRTKLKIPELYDNSQGAYIITVSSIDGSKIIKKSQEDDFSKRKNNPFSKDNTMYYFYKDGYIYGDLPKAISVKGYFKETLSDCDSSTNSSDSCNRFLDKEFKIPDYLEAQIISYVVKDLFPSINIPSQEKIDKNENKP